MIFLSHYKYFLSSDTAISNVKTSIYFITPSSAKPWVCCIQGKLLTLYYLSTL